ncbi:ydiI hotdog fold superfamily [Klebsiella pneumoniae]|nr:ydiI hotdog fold superfamily [Klebsiella pneumoniae]STT31693.1 ydiI hotdog fold superfamily [Klebsiella pneumoniae]STU40826.1 ydiI hotdog fold superfamily [Klebsiella pneumoniae]VTR47056.1 ydiI hotdog fold superfamily [Klebsiella pneumoniae]
MIWKRQATLEQLNRLGEGNMVGLLDIRFETVTDDTLEATMPVDSRTQQPFGLLHGGASVVLAETLGSVAGYLCSEGEQKVVGLEVNANHIRSARGAGCAASAKRCTSGRAIRSGKLKSSTNSRGYVVHHD